MESQNTPNSTDNNTLLTTPPYSITPEKQQIGTSNVDFFQPQNKVVGGDQE